MQKIEYLIDARKLKYILANKSDFSKWIKTKIKSNELIENKDFFLEKEEMKSLNNGSIKTNYFLTFEAAEKIILNHAKNSIAKRIREEIQKVNPLQDILRKISEEKQMQIRIIKINDTEYPEQLKQKKNPPQQLYVKGSVENMKEHGLAVIGSRNCSNYGRRICKIFTNNLVGYNLNIISGLAVGIDTCAHKACIEAKGKTIAVLPSGFNKIFPRENEELLNIILENGGTVITEYPPEFEKTQDSCRERNRIMSGLAIGTLVIEAEKRSGTSITIGYANEQKKKAFCVPASLLNSKGIGTNKMIQEDKAKLVTEVEDIIKEFPKLNLERKIGFNFAKVDKENETKKTEKILKSYHIEIEKENLEIYNYLTKEPKTVDEIAIAINKPVNEITYKLTLLQLQGAIEELPGKKFKIK